jgi:hypothetical protein
MFMRRRRRRRRRAARQKGGGDGRIRMTYRQINPLSRNVDLSGTAKVRYSQGTCTYIDTILVGKRTWTLYR